MWWNLNTEIFNSVAVYELVRKQLFYKFFMDIIFLRGLNLLFMCMCI